MLYNESYFNAIKKIPNKISFHEHFNAARTENRLIKDIITELSCMVGVLLIIAGS